MDYDNHKEKVEKNMEFLKTFYSKKNPYKDWMIVTLFYIALHCIDAYFAKVGVIEIFRGTDTSQHGERYKKIKEDLPELKTNYRRLEQFSREARYDQLGKYFKWSDIKKYFKIINDEFLPLLEQ